MESTPISKHIPMVYNPAEVMAIVFAPTLTLSGSSLFEGYPPED